jgi:hypothetical protein
MQELRRMKNARFLSSLEFVGLESSKNQILPNVIPTGELAVSLHIKAVAHDAGAHSTECYTLDCHGSLKKIQTGNQSGVPLEVFERLEGNDILFEPRESGDLSTV